MNKNLDYNIVSIAKKVKELQNENESVLNGIDELNDEVTTIEEDITSITTEVNNLAKGHIYSTEEKQIGLWVDGTTPVYEKVITLSEPLSCASLNWTDTEITIPNLDRLINVIPSLKRTGESYISPMFARYTTSLALLNPINVQFVTQTFVIQYTKTDTQSLNDVETE